MIQMHSIITASSAQVSCDLDNEAVILNMESGTYFGLDPIGARIWSLIQTQKTVEEIRDRLLEDYDVDAERCGHDLLALLEELVHEGLAEVRSWPESGR